MLSRYLKLLIGDKPVVVTNPEELPVVINYSLEDPDNFQTKKSSEALSIEVPAALMNDEATNTYRNPDVVDMTADQYFRGNLPFVIDENGIEIMMGKAFLKRATHNRRPKSYTFDLFGDNADWKVDMEELTLYEILKHISFTFSKANIIASWDFDGTDPLLPYVFAPIRYRDPMGGRSLDGNGNEIIDDNNVLPQYMRPAISKWFIIYWAFKSLGYRVESNFWNSEYGRRQTMPWTWGNFLDSAGTRLDTHKFLAKSTQDQYYDSPNGGHDFIWDLDVSNDSTDGAFDNNGDYTYNTGTKAMTWTYNAPHYGILEATFSCQIYYSLHATGNSDVYLRIQWFKNGVFLPGLNGDFSANGNEVAHRSATGLGGTEAGIRDMFFTATVNPGDVITAKIHLHTFESKIGTASATANVLGFKLDYFKIPLGGTIDFANYTGFKSYKFLEYLRGVTDEFNFSYHTDPVNKVVTIEPTHAYSTSNNLSDKEPGYFKDDFVDWNGKEDLSKDWVLENYSEFDREFTFKYRDDGNDGVLKKVQDRNISVLAAGKYVFPSRFKAGKKEHQNRFFGPTMHYEVEQWKSITGVAPQLICMIPENISNTSNSESANTFIPKSTYYKGLVSGVGGWRFDGTEYTNIPYMFAVNYKPGGENDPILSYCDERIQGSSGFVIGKGLLKRFFWQRLAIMRNGQRYNGWFRLKNVDVVNSGHREYKSYRGQKWELININGYTPLDENSTGCLIQKWEPVTQRDLDNTFPSSTNVLAGNSSNPFDIKYAPLKCLTTDIPTK